MKIKALIILLFLLLGGLVLSQNSRPGQVQFFSWRFSAPLDLLLFTCYLLGFVIGGLGGWKVPEKSGRLTL